MNQGICDAIYMGKTNDQHENQSRPYLSEQVNKAVWAACDTFRGTVDPSIYKDFILTMLFLKYISDVHQDKYEELKENTAMSQN